LDGTWLYYNFAQDFGHSGPIISRHGEYWGKKYFIDWKKFPKLISSNLSKQLILQASSKRTVEVVRTSVFTSLRSDTIVGSPREKMVEDFYKANFDVHKYVSVSTILIKALIHIQ